MESTTTVKPPPRAQVGLVIARYLKDDISWTPRREFPLFYTLWKRYPSLAFWTHHELPFKLHSLAWFLSQDGASQLSSDYIVFHFRFPDKEVDIDSQPSYDTGTQSPAPVLETRARTTADFLTQPNHGKDN